LQTFEKIFNDANSYTPEERIHLLIISAHGVPYTGTNLEVSSGKSIDLSLYKEYFRVLPKDLVIYVSACWGGYPSVIQGICGNADNPPILIAPLIPIEQHQNIKIQNSIIDCLLNHSDYEEQLIQTIKRLNEKLKKSYYEQPIVRIVTKNGEQIPGLEAAFLAAKIEEYKKYLVVALQDIFPGCPNDFLQFILYDGASLWMILKYELSSFNDIFEIEDPYLAIGRAIELKGKILSEPSSLNIGQLTDIIKVRKIPDKKIPDRLKYEVPYPHCKEKPDSERIHVTMGFIHRGSPCLVCNWAIFDDESGVDEKDDLKIKVSCRRSNCEAHNLQTDRYANKKFWIL